MADTQNRDICYFINFYSICWFWKKSHSSDVASFYRTFLPSVNDPQKGDKTLYDRILRLGVANIGTIQKRIGHLPELTGLPKKYFDGTDFLKIPDLHREDWEILIKLREKRKDKIKTQAQIDCEGKIHSALLRAYERYQSCSDDLHTIIHYVKTGKRLSKDTVKDKVAQITILINQFTKKDLEQMDGIGDYAKLLQGHLNKVYAVIALKDFT